MPRTIASFTNDELNAAVHRVLQGDDPKVVCAQTNIRYRTLMKWVAEGRKGVFRSPKRRGPAPLLPAEAEQSLFDWVVGRQHVGHPATRQEIIHKASHISSMVTGQAVGEGWYRRYMERYPCLSIRTSEAVAKARSSVTEADTRLLFMMLLKVIVKHKLDASRVFNIDETAFQTSKGSKRVSAVRGSTNVWHPDLSANFHLSIVACRSAAEFVVPPVFILPGVTVKLGIWNGCSIPGTAVTTTSSGFMNGFLFVEWLRFFSKSAPNSVPRPLLLLLDGCSPHYSATVICVAASLGIMLVLLPANSTHLLQPFGVAVFAPFKSHLRLLSDIYIGDTGSCTINKEHAIKMACTAWETCNFGQNVAAGFKGCGIFLLSKPQMDKRLYDYLRNGTPQNIAIAEWLKVKATMQLEVLSLPPPRKRARKTATVGG